MDWVVVEKSTGDIYTITAYRYAGSGKTTVTLVGKDGIEFEITSKELEKKYEKPKYDFSLILPVVERLLDNNELARRLIRPIARRLHPGGYFHEKDLVYFENSPNEKDVPSFRRETFIINKIEADRDNRNRFWLDLYYFRGPGVKYSGAPDFRLHIDKSIWSLQDAYYYLKRYDEIY